jgi:predicted Fe-Mo cluster-binding NifX family protein
MARELVVCVPVSADGLLGPSWGRAERVAVATVRKDGIGDWQEFEVGWGDLHDAGTEGSHHARIARFLIDHQVQAVAAHHMGAPMVNMLSKMGLTVRLGQAGNARDVAATLL